MCGRYSGVHRYAEGDRLRSDTAWVSNKRACAVIGFIFCGCIRGAGVVRTFMFGEVLCFYYQETAAYIDLLGAVYFIIRRGQGRSICISYGSWCGGGGRGGCSAVAFFSGKKAGAERG